MSAPYSYDLRKKAIAAVKRGERKSTRLGKIGEKGKLGTVKAGKNQSKCCP